MNLLIDKLNKIVPEKSVARAGSENYEIYATYSKGFNDARSEMEKNLRAEDWSEYVKVSDVVAELRAYKDKFPDAEVGEAIAYIIGMEIRPTRPQGEELK